MPRIKEGFPGQRLIVMPFYKLRNALENPLVQGLVIHSMGHYPHAENHYYARAQGCNEYILIYCTQGEGWFELDNKVHRIKAHTFFILPADTPHRYGAGESSPWHIYWLHFKGDKAPAVYERLKGVHTISPDGDSRLGDRIKLFDELLNLLEGEISDENYNYANLALTHLLATFLYIAPFRKAKNIRNSAQNTYFISLATHFMNEHVDKELRLKDMAGRFGYSQSYFHRLFQRETGYSPMQYFLNLKIGRAQQLLQDTNVKINQIALRSGFEDPYYFSRCFKKFTGSSPKEYREKFSKGDKLR